MQASQVTVRIEGGLGNQLFQYAAGRSLADRLGCDLALDLRGLDVQGDRPFQLNGYKIRATIADSNLLNSIPDVRASRWNRFKSSVSQLFPKFLSFRIFWSRTFAFDRRFDKLTYPVHLIGYWQSEKYFFDNRSAILRDIQPVLPIALAGNLIHEIENSVSVALHIRRGDYINNESNFKFHGTCEISYYQAAIKKLKSKLSTFKVFIFSDDIEWSKINLKLDIPAYYVENEGCYSSLTDIELMRRCKHHIIANSSFSWWGAWLCIHPEQIVCAPARWFADTKTNASDVIPERWIKII
jgi:hypothetical protein